MGTFGIWFFEVSSASHQDLLYKQSHKHMHEVQMLGWEEEEKVTLSRLLRLYP